MSYMKSLVIIPAYNEIKTVKNVVKVCKKYASDILIIDDGSTDGTYETIKDLKIKILRNKINRGKGYSIRKGFDYAIKKKYDVVITTDADGEIPLSEIPKLINKLTKDVDIVIGKRDIYRSFLRKNLNKFALFWINFTTGYRLHDPYSGLRAFKVLALKKMKLCSDRFEIEPEMILEASKNNLNMKEVVIGCGKLSPSKLNLHDQIYINNFFDKWVLKNITHLNLNVHKKIFLFISCHIGRIIGKILEQFIKGYSN